MCSSTVRTGAISLQAKRGAPGLLRAANRGGAVGRQGKEVDAQRDSRDAFLRYSPPDPRSRKRWRRMHFGCSPRGLHVPSLELLTSERESTTGPGSPPPLIKP
ncbi:hypothetical protein Pla52o_32790 [Novipirellula galeiformis]|uniref:Uncharacterized protein n=1 Tax=Novipirellula galeiformis TaxID=2528004 RepID=A0A5C6CBS8_9BACT|nr:hypothetical protein Pla52o_32790 [Novipirellula galeiformis]